VADPFFLDVEPGQRFCLYHRAAPDTAYRGAILYLHPFAEELNKSRRMAALQSRAFAIAGFDVLQVDLYGCGDSDGDFVDARWKFWQRDAMAAQAWLGRQGRGPFYLWGLRLGALLALDVANHSRPAAILLWQPEMDGRAHLKHFLRLRLASSMGAGKLQDAADLDGNIEVGGYEISAVLARDLGQRDARNFTLPSCPVLCYWVNASGSAPAMRLTHPRLASHAVQGPPFWITGEIAECPALIAASTRALAA
jgi:exosortase A-associated hydrolase 2